MSGYRPQDPVGRLTERVEDLREGLQSQNKSLAYLMQQQRLQGEMLAKVLEVITKQPEGDGLGDLLRDLIAADRHHAEMLEKILTAVTQPAGGRP